MSFEFYHLTNILEAISGPIVALILGLAFVHGCRLLVEAHESRSRALERAAGLVASRVSFAVLRSIAKLHPTPVRPDLAQLEATCERVLVAIVQAVGGFPGSAKDQVGRQLVREVRKMYEEIEKPTPEGVAGAGTSSVYAGDVADDLTLDEVYGPDERDTEEEEDI